MEELLRRTIGDLDVDYAEARIEQAESVTIEYMGPVLETIAPKFTLGGCIRVCVDGGWGFASFNDLDEARDSALAARDMARGTAGNGTVLAPVEPVVDTIRTKVATDPSDIRIEEKIQLLGNYNSLILGEKDIVTSRSIYRDTKKTVWLHTSDGTMLEQEKIYAGVSLMAVGKDGANVQRGHRSFGDMRGYDTVLDREGDIGEIVKTTRDLLSAPKVDSGVYPVILDPQLAGVFIHEAFGHLSEADFVYENPRAREMMTLGRRFGPDMLNVVDDGSLSGENGFVGYDEEGVRNTRSHLIRDGLLVGRLHSRETAGKMGERPTGNARALNFTYRPIVRMASTFIESGDHDFGAMVESIDNGIYACGFLGGNTDLERFTFSSANAYRIENGKITTPVRDVVLSGNVFQTLHSIAAIGSKRELFGGLGGCGKGGQSPLPVSDGSPHIRIDNVLIG